jgi:hypothetical protein
MHVSLHPPRASLRDRDCHRADNLLSTPAAERLSTLNRCTASIAEHCFALQKHPANSLSLTRSLSTECTKKLPIKFLKVFSIDSRNISLRNECNPLVPVFGPIRNHDFATRMPQFIPRRSRSQLKRKGHPATGQPFLQGRIVPTEASDSVKTFCRNLMSLKTGVSSDFSEINAFVFFNLQTEATLGRSAPF